MAVTVRASQPSLIRSWRADDPAPKSAATDQPLFDLDSHERATGVAPQNTPQNTHVLTPLGPEASAEAGERWARILKEQHQFCHVVKRVAADFEQAGVLVDLRTVQGWLQGKLAANKHLMAAARIYGTGILAEVLDPESAEATASRTARWGKILEGGRR